jgi:hypothetical protein
MAFPDSIETTIGLAGPTADIGHEAAHAASGIPRLLTELQNQIGTDRTLQSFSPTWNVTGANATPAVDDCEWAQFGPIVWIDIYVAWGAGDVNFGTQLIASSLGIPTPAGSGPVFTAQFVDAGTPRSVQALLTSGQLAFWETNSGGKLSGANPSGTIRLTGMYWTLA